MFLKEIFRKHICPYFEMFLILVDFLQSMLLIEVSIVMLAKNLLQLN